MWFFVQLCSSWQDFNWLKGSCGLSAAAELLVCFLMHLLTCRLDYSWVPLPEVLRNSAVPSLWWLQRFLQNMLLAMNVEHYLIFWVISSIAFINLLVSASENQHKDNIPSVRSSMVDEETIRFVHRLGSVVSVSFGALTLLVGWQEGHPTSTKTCTTYLREVLICSLWRTKAKADLDSPG